MSVTEIAPRMLSAAEVAAMLGISVQGVYRLIHRDELPASRVLKQLRVDPAELEAFIASGKVH